MSNNPQLKNLLTSAEKHLHNMFLAGAVFGALSCFARADYNLPLYSFLYIMWDQDDNDKLKLMVLMALTFIGDLFWMVYWVPHWWGSEMAKWQLALHSFVIFVTFANFVLKAIIIGTLATVREADLRNAIGKLRNRV